MPRRVAAAYCGVSVNHFRARVPVEPIYSGAKPLWDRADIDAWIDGLKTPADNQPDEWGKALAEI